MNKRQLKIARIQAAAISKAVKRYLKPMTYSKSYMDEHDKRMYEWFTMVASKVGAAKPLTKAYVSRLVVRNNRVAMRPFEYVTCYGLATLPGDTLSEVFGLTSEIIGSSLGYRMPPEEPKERPPLFQSKQAYIEHVSGMVGKYMQAPQAPQAPVFVPVPFVSI